MNRTISFPFSGSLCNRKSQIMTCNKMRLVQVTRRKGAEWHLVKGHIALWNRMQFFLSDLLTGNWHYKAYGNDLTSSRFVTCI